jgi:hypothetical protein
MFDIAFATVVNTGAGTLAGSTPGARLAVGTELGVTAGEGPRHLLHGYPSQQQHQDSTTGNQKL